MTQRGPRSRRSADQYQFNDPDAAQLLLRYVIGMALKGGAMRVGLTRDGGALAVGMYLGEDYATEYIRPSEDLSMALREIGLAWDVWPADFDEVAEMYIAH